MTFCGCLCGEDKPKKEEAKKETDVVTQQLAAATALPAAAAPAADEPAAPAAEIPEEPIAVAPTHTVPDEEASTKM